MLILITPNVFFGTMEVVGQFDSGGFGTGLFAVLNPFLFLYYDDYRGVYKEHKIK